MNEESAPTGYKLLLVPADQVTALSGGFPRMATVAAESSVCNCDNFRAGPFEVVAETDSAGRLVMSGLVFDGIIVKRGPGGPCKRQRLTWNTSFRPPLWTCSGCGSGLVNGILAHHDTCTEVR